MPVYSALLYESFLLTGSHFASETPKALHLLSYNGSSRVSGCCKLVTDPSKDTPKVGIVVWVGIWGTTSCLYFYWALA